MRVKVAGTAAARHSMGITSSGIDGNREFPDTSWSALRDLRDPRSPEYERHIARLVATYWRPVYWVIRWKFCANGQDARDLTQEFFAGAVLGGSLLQTFSPERGSFRAYLRGAICKFMLARSRDANTEKRGGGVRLLSLSGDPGDPPIDFPDSAAATPEAIFDAAWKAAVIAEALRTLEQRLRGHGRAVDFELFKRYDLELERKALSYAELGAAFSLSGDQVKHALVQVRSLLRDVVMEVVRGYIDRVDDLEAEVKGLLG